MNVVIVEMRKPNGKLVRTFRETFCGGTVSGQTIAIRRERMKAIALATTIHRVASLFPGNTFSVRNSNM